MILLLDVIDTDLMHGDDFIKIRLELSSALRVATDHRFETVDMINVVRKSYSGSKSMGSRQRLTLWR